HTQQSLIKIKPICAKRRANELSPVTPRTIKLWNFSGTEIWKGQQKSNYKKWNKKLCSIYEHF
ncbi:unnamed protein product, partial [Ceratitis capitata]